MDIISKYFQNREKIPQNPANFMLKSLDNMENGEMNHLWGGWDIRGQMTANTDQMTVKISKRLLFFGKRAEKIIINFVYPENEGKFSDFAIRKCHF